MDFLSQIGKKALEQVLGNNGASSFLSAEHLQLVQNLLQKVGGIEGLLAKLKQFGLDEKVLAWVQGVAGSSPVTGPEIQNALGSDLEQAAAEAGQDPQVAANGLADALPQLLSQFLGGGEGSSGNAEADGGLNVQNLMKKFFS